MSLLASRCHRRAAQSIADARNNPSKRPAMTGLNQCRKWLLGHMWWLQVEAPTLATAVSSVNLVSTQTCTGRHQRLALQQRPSAPATWKRALCISPCPSQSISCWLLLLECLLGLARSSLVSTTHTATRKLVAYCACSLKRRSSGFERRLISTI